MPSKNLARRPGDRVHSAADRDDPASHDASGGTSRNARDFTQSTGIASSRARTTSGQFQSPT